MQLKTLLFIFLILFYSINLVSAETVTVTTTPELQTALDYAAENPGTTIYLSAGTYNVDHNKMYVPSDTTITGDSTAIVKLIEHSYTDPTPSVTRAIFQARGDSAHDITFHGFTIDGNEVHKKIVSHSNDHLNLIQLYKTSNVQVYDMTLKNGLGDGIKIRDGSNAKIHDNTIDRIGHDAIWTTRVTDVDIYNNWICCRVNSGVRIVDGNNIKVHDNEITSKNQGGAGIEIQKPRNDQMNVEIYNNKIYHTRDAGIWAYGYQQATSESSNIVIHDNEITDCGLHRGGGVTIHGMNVLLENNKITENINYDVGVRYIDINIITADAPADLPHGDGYKITLINNDIGSEVLNELIRTHTISYDSENLVPEKKSTGNIITVQECDGDGDQEQINAALQQGGTVTLEARTYTLTDSIILQSDTVLEGVEGTIITIPDHVGWAVWKPLILATGCSNIKIKNIEFNGNSDNNQDVGKHTKNGKAWGNGYYNFIHVIDSDSVEVSGCLMHDGLGDGLRTKTSTNIIFKETTAYRLGHEGAFFIDSENIEAYNNRITTRTSNALRIWNCAHVRFYDNVLDSDLTLRSLAGMGAFQIEDSKGTVSDVEICNNIIFNTWGPAIWLIAYDNGSSNNQAVSIHHNLFYQVAQSYNIAYTAGITVNGQKGTEIKNNVFDGAYNGAVLVLSGGQGSTLQDNIITSTEEHSGIYQAGTGYGISNRAGSSLSILNNCFFGNENGDLYKCSSSGDDLDNPKTHITSSGWIWSGNTWTCDGAMPADLGAIEPAEPPEPGEPATIDHDISQFDNIFDILDLEFSTSGRTGQTAEDIDIEIEEHTKGLIYGGLKIVGFADVVYIDGVPYIPDENAILVKYKVIQSPDLIGWIGRIQKMEKIEEKYIKNGTAYAVLTVKSHWYTVKTDPVTGAKRKSKIKTSTAVFRDSCPAPEILPKEHITKAYVNVFSDTANPFAKVTTGHTDTTQRIEYTYEKNTTTRTFMIGERATDETGLQYTAYSRCDVWAGDIPHMGNDLILVGKFDQTQLHIKYYTPYETFEIEDIDIIYHENKEESRTMIILKFIIYLALAMYAGYKIMKTIIT
jgi:hypothetical protein